MNIFYKITARSLSKNKTRTFVTIIGVILSAALITGVATFITSLQNYLLRAVIADRGEWHVALLLPGSAIEDIVNDDDVKAAFIMQNIGDTLIDVSEPDGVIEFPKRITALSDDVFREVPIRITDGRLPQSYGEMLMPARFREYYHIGQTYSFEIGDMKLMPVDPENPELGFGGWGFYGSTEVRQYTVVGYYDGRFVDSIDLLITRMDNLSNARINYNETYTLLLQLRNPSRAHSFVERYAEFAPHTNSPLLRNYGVFGRDSFMRTYYFMGAILVFVIMVGSVSLINNAFSISVSERSRQFGILSSVGATRKQIISSVLFEGLIVSAIGIPLGVLSGVVGIGITLRFVGGMIISRIVPDLTLSLFVSIPAIMIAVAIALLTVLISAYIPAARAGKVSAIEAIRQVDDIKLKAKEVRGGWLLGKLFGIEGALALKNFKRNKKRYRSTIFSLFISIVIFITAASFGLYLNLGQGGMVEIPKYNITYIVPLSLSDTVEDFERVFYEMKAEDHVVDGVWVLLAGSDFYSPQTVFSQSRLEQMPRAESRPDYIGTINIAFMQDEAFITYLGQLGLPPDEFLGMDATRTVAISNRRNHNVGGRVVWEDSFIDTAEPLDVELLYWRNILDEVPGHGERILITLTDFTEQTPDFINLGSFTANLDIIIPASRGPLIPYLFNTGFSPYFMFESTDPFATCENFHEILTGFGEQTVSIERNLINHTAWGQANSQMVFVINIFTYGFTILMSLIAVANVFNTIHTSIRMRRRELAMLKSIGLSDRGFGKMMNYECLFYGIKALLYGLPVAGLMTYLIYLAMNQGVDLPFVIPELETVFAIVGVFTIVFASMFYSTRCIKRENIIDALRDELT